jgi:hypothetical protein
MGDLIPIRPGDEILDVEEYPDLPIQSTAAEILVILRDAIAGADEQREELAAAGDMESLAIGLVAFRMLVRDLLDATRTTSLT